MRALSATLLAAQKSASGLPFVQVKVSERVAGVPLLRWTRLYTGSEPDRYHATAMPGDGSLLRLRIDSAGPTLYYQRVTSPGPGSAFGTWTNLGSAADAGVALAANGARVLRFWVASGGLSVLVQESTDNGATFGSSVTAVTAGAAIGWLAAAVKSDGTAFLIYSVGGTVFVVKRVSGVWGSPNAWPYSASQIKGLAVAHSGDYHLAIATVEASGEAKLWTAVYGDGFSQAVDTWSALRELTKADSGSNIGFRAPSLAVVGSHRLFFIEEYTGSVSYSRPYWTWFPPAQSFAANAWREPVPFDLSSSYGVAITGSATHAWLSTPSGVWRAPLTPAEVDLSADVSELAVELRRRSGRARVVLRNDDGRYNDLSGTYAPVRLGAELSISPGYQTSAGQEVSAGPRYWIEGWERTSAGGEAAFVLHARDGWALVEAWRARRQFSWVAGSTSVSQIMRFVFGRAGIDLVDSGSSATALNHKPSFTIHPGEDGLRAIERLLAVTPDVAGVSGEFAYLLEPKATDAAVYSYGTDHAIFRGRYANEGLAANRAQVFGSGVVAERFDWPAIADELDLLRQVHDLSLTSSTLADDRAAATLRQEELALALGEIVTPVNCGQELGDVVSITDPQAGLSAAKHRVVGLELRFARRGRSVYEQRVLLGRA